MFKKVFSTKTPMPIGCGRDHDMPMKTLPPRLRGPVFPFEGLSIFATQVSVNDDAKCDVSSISAQRRLLDAPLPRFRLFVGVES